jgi:uncharacterized SAM-binding protein YcdF (DUF218 family)
VRSVVRGFSWALALAVVGLVAVIITYETVPRGNTDQTHFDTLIVLGSPADPDGKPSVEQRERVMEAVREFQKGRADHLIVTGGAAHNAWIEGMIEAEVARKGGVPADAVLTEVRSKNTIENVYYAWQMMQARGWKSAEVVSSHSHLPRASLILEHYEPLGLKWHVHASHWPREYPTAQIASYYVYEAFGTTALRWFGYRKHPHLPEQGAP